MDHDAESTGRERRSAQLAQIRLQREAEQSNTTASTAEQRASRAETRAASEASRRAESTAEHTREQQRAMGVHAATAARPQEPITQNASNTLQVVQPLFGEL